MTSTRRSTAISPWADPHRPVFHFTPDRDRYRINDPNGLIHWKGQYHLFYQYNPFGPYVDNTHWGHAVSDDLATWEHLPIALGPTAGGPDSAGCYSGCAVDDNGTPTLIYTGITSSDHGSWTEYNAGLRSDIPQRPCLATSDDDLVTWKKYSGNPIIADPPQNQKMFGFRDHVVWQEDDDWFQIIGAGTQDGGDAFLYKSHNLREWTFLGSVMGRPLKERGTMWECPDFFSLDQAHVLLISRLPHLMAGDVWRARVQYLSGQYSQHKFVWERSEVLDAGGNLYAPQSMVDALGRRLLWGWITEGRSRAAQQIAGWTGVISLPRVLRLDSDGWLHQTPEGGTNRLRKNHRNIQDLDISSSSLDLPEIYGDVLELHAKFETGTATSLGLQIRCSPAKEEVTTIVVDFEDGSLSVDRTRSSLDGECVLTTETGRVPPFDKTGMVELVVYVDKSVLEVFFNGYAATSRMYPMRADSVGIAVFACNGTAKLVSLDAWEMDSIW